MLRKVFTSNWFAIPVFIVAAASVGMLYLTERTTEALIGAALLAVAAILMLLGREKKDRDIDEL